MDTLHTLHIDTCYIANKLDISAFSNMLLQLEDIQERRWNNLENCISAVRFGTCGTAKQNKCRKIQHSRGEHQGTGMPGL